MHLQSIDIMALGPDFANQYPALLYQILKCDDLGVHSTHIDTFIDLVGFDAEDRGLMLSEGFHMDVVFSLVDVDMACV